MERLRELIISGEGAKEIRDIDHHITSLSEINSKTTDLLGALEELKGLGINSVVHIDQDRGVIKLRGDDMLTLAMQREASFEQAGENFHTKIPIGNASVEGMLKAIDTFHIKREKKAFVFSDGSKARDLYEFMEKIDLLESNQVEHYLYNGDFNKWLNSIEKKGLGLALSKIKKKGLFGDELKSKLIKTTKSYVKGQVKKEVKERIKKDLKEKLLSAMDDLK
jgi:hypothetical protein